MSQTLRFAETQIAKNLKTLSTPNSVYYSNRQNGDFSLDLKAHKNLSNQEKDEICNLINQYSYDPNAALDDQSKRGFLGNPNTEKKFQITGNQLVEPPMRSDWLLIKNKGKVIAYMNVTPFDRETNDELSKCLAKAACRRPVTGNGFLRCASVVDSEFRGRNIFRLMLEALKEAYQASYSISYVFPQNTPSIEANHSVGAEDVGGMENGQRLFVLDFSKYIRAGETKPKKVLYPFTDTSGNYPNLSNQISHTKNLGTQHAVDFPIPVGTEIKAVVEGTVKFVLDSNPDYQDGEASFDMDPKKCNAIVIEGDDGLMQEYVHIAHNSSQVKVGDKVKAGDLICKSGHNGPSTEPHLHFCLLKEDSSKETGYNSVPIRFINSYK
jgi:murein DD-endopeptidase MepM/ murein hydrolase activator NlpD